MDDPEAFGQLGAALYFEHKALGLESPEAVHDPVVFFDQHGVELTVVCDNRKQLIEVTSFVKKVSHRSNPERVYEWPYCRSCLMPLGVGVD